MAVKGRECELRAGIHFAFTKKRESDGRAIGTYRKVESFLDWTSTDSPQHRFNYPIEGN